MEALIMLKKMVISMILALIASTQIAPISYASESAQADIVVYLQVEYFAKTTITYTTIQKPRPTVPGLTGEFMYLHVTENDYNWTNPDGSGVKSISDNILIQVECNDRTRVTAPNNVVLMSTTNPPYNVAMTLNFFGGSGSGSGSDLTSTWFEIDAPGTAYPAVLTATVSKDWKPEYDRAGMFRGTFTITISEVF
jgi:hypothetical protein